jgi:hypothetical protein
MPILVIGELQAGDTGLIFGRGRRCVVPAAAFHHGQENRLPPVSHGMKPE